MASKTNQPKSMNVFKFTSIFLGSLITIWSSAAILSGLAQVNWQVSELLRQYLIAVGLMQEFHTLTDFYTHIKGVEYIIAVLFLGTFRHFMGTLINRPRKWRQINQGKNNEKRAWPVHTGQAFFYCFPATNLCS